MQRSRPAMIILAVLGGILLVVAGSVAGNYLGRGQIDVPGLADRAGISECGYEPPQPRPSSVTLTCADGGVTAHDLVWSYWGLLAATGTGIITANTCTPDCATGQLIDYPAQVFASQVTVPASGSQFTHLAVVYDDASPLTGTDVVDTKTAGFDLHLSTLSR